MANTFSITYRKRRKSVFHPAFAPRSGQVERTNQTVSSSGSSVAIRPRKTAIRRYNNSGAGEVGYF